MLDEDQAINGLTVLTRLVQREPEKRPLLRRALDADLATLAPLAVRVALETGEPMPSVLSEVLAESEAGSDVLARVEQVLPMFTDSMVGLAAQVTGARVRSLEPGSSELATALVDHAQFLADAGKAGEAVAHAREGLALLRNRNDDPHALARALWTLSRCENMSGSPEAAVRLAQEAVAIERTLAGGAPTGALAVAVCNYAESLAGADDNDGALACYDEALDMLRRLVASAPSPLSYRLDDAARSGTRVWINMTPGPYGTPSPSDAVAIDAEGEVEPSALRHILATALTSCVDLLMLQGRTTEAKAAAEEAVELLRDLAADQPDAYRISLAAALASHATVLADDEPARALPPAEEAAEILRSSHRGQDTIERQLAAALVARSMALFYLKRWDEALAATQELAALAWAVEDDRRLGLLLRQFEELSARLSEAGESDAAITASRAAVATARRLPADDGPNEASLASALHNLGRRLRDAGDADAARTSSAEAFALAAPHFLDGHLDEEELAKVLLQYVVTSEAVGDVLDTTTPLAEVVDGLVRALRADPQYSDPLSKIAVNVVEAFRATGDIEAAIAVLDALLELTHARPGDRSPKVTYAFAGFNVVNDLVATGRVRDAEPIVERLVAMCEKDEPWIVRSAGKAACITMVAYVGQDEQAAATRIARLAEPALRSQPYLAARREELEEASPSEFLSALDGLLGASPSTSRSWPLRWLRG